MIHNLYIPNDSVKTPLPFNPHFPISPGIHILDLPEGNKYGVKHILAGSLLDFANLENEIKY